MIATREAGATVSGDKLRMFGSAERTGTSVQREIAGLGSLREGIGELLALPRGFQNGWVRVTGTGPIAGFVAYAQTLGGGLAVVPGQTARQTSLLFAHVAELPPWQTGIALLNTTSTAATVEVFAMTPEGRLIGGASTSAGARLQINPGAKRALLISEMIPQTQTRRSRIEKMHTRPCSIPSRWASSRALSSFWIFDSKY